MTCKHMAFVFAVLGYLKEISASTWINRSTVQAVELFSPGADALPSDSKQKKAAR